RLSHLNKSRPSADHDTLPQGDGLSICAGDLHQQHVAAAGDSSHGVEPEGATRAGRAALRVDLSLADQARAARGPRRKPDGAGHLRRLAALLCDLARYYRITPGRSLRPSRALRPLWSGRAVGAIGAIGARGAGGPLRPGRRRGWWVQPAPVA